MFHFTRGAVGTLTAIGLVSLGAFCGWKAREKFRAKAVQDVNEEARRRVEAEQQAFSDMMNYNIETAYGMDSGLKNLFGGEG